MINRLKTHEFHFVLNNKLKAKLLNISDVLSLSLSKTIIFIIENIEALFNKMHLIYNQDNLKVEKVNWDEHIHLFMRHFGN